MKGHCETCPTIRDCQTAFGDYWGEKSCGGVGCEHPFKYDLAFAVPVEAAAEADSATARDSRQGEEADGWRLASGASRRGRRNETMKQEMLI